VCARGTSLPRARHRGGRGGAGETLARLAAAWAARPLWPVEIHWRLAYRRRDEGGSMDFRCNALVVLAATAFLGGCTTNKVLPPVQPFQAGANPGELVHKDSGFAFPSRIGSFLRVTGHQYDAQGRDISVG